MMLSIEEYAHLVYTHRPHLDERIGKHVEYIHQWVSERVRVSFPIYHVNAYNVNSCMVHLDEKEPMYHIIDQSTFHYFELFAQAFYKNQPNFVKAIYNLLRHDICLSLGDKNNAEKYKNNPIYYTLYDSKIDKQWQRNPLNIINQITFGMWFYFLHEYAHYFIDNPVRENFNPKFTEEIVDILTENMISHAESFNQKRKMDTFSLDEYIYLAIKGYKLYHSDKEFNVEIMCDIQSLLALLEHADRFSVRDIVEGAIIFLYTQYFVRFAKHINNFLEIPLAFPYRINLLCHFALLLEDEKISDILAQALNKSNKYNNLTTVRCEPIDFDRINSFFRTFINITNLDIAGQLAGSVFSGDFDSDIFEVCEKQSYIARVYPEDYLL